MDERIAVISDAHGNLPALDAALAQIHAEGIPRVYHLGDAIGIGPFPAETLDRLLHTPELRLLIGNHDALFAFGLPEPTPPWMGAGEVAHQRWVHDQLDPRLRAVIREWPWRIDETLGNVATTFMHYALDAEGDGFAPIVRRPDRHDLDRIFADVGADVVFYGHHHHPSVVTRVVEGRARYLTPGSLGCTPDHLAPYLIYDPSSNQASVRHARYDRSSLLLAFEERAVPERAFLISTFFT